MSSPEIWFVIPRVGERWYTVYKHGLSIPIAITFDLQQRQPRLSHRLYKNKKTKILLNVPYTLEKGDRVWLKLNSNHFNDIQPHRRTQDTATTPICLKGGWKLVASDRAGSRLSTLASTLICLFHLGSLHGFGISKLKTYLQKKFRRCKEKAE
jgi:hypothetical protein